MTLENSNLFKSIKVGPVTLKNRIVHAPTTRSRVTLDHIPTDSMLKYYEERAENNGGLIILEGAFVEEEFTNQLYFPSWSNEKTGKAMKIIVDAVHKKGSYISAQLLYIGRMASLMMMKKMLMINMIQFMLHHQFSWMINKRKILKIIILN